MHPLPWSTFATAIDVVVRRHRRDDDALRLCVVIAPHAAWYSEEALVGLQAGAPNEVRRVLSGQWPVNVVNPAVRGKNRAGL